MKASWKRVNQHWCMVFGLLVLVGLINIGGLLLCCVGILFTLPIGLGALMYAYETIFSSPKRKPVSRSCRPERRPGQSVRHARPGLAHGRALDGGHADNCFWPWRVLSSSSCGSFEAMIQYYGQIDRRSSAASRRRIGEAGTVLFVACMVLGLGDEREPAVKRDGMPTSGTCRKQADPTGESSPRTA